MKVIMAMSGGVDSSVGAALLLEQNYEVIGVTMQLWAEDLPYGSELEGGCCSIGAVEDARTVANRLGIPYYVLNMHAPFRQRVIDYFVAEYIRGRTPNPCVVCNQQLKFDLLLEKARNLGASKLATGHYIRTKFDESLKRWIMLKGIDQSKDQSYVLYGMTQQQLASTLFPLGEYAKIDIRKKADSYGMTVANKPDSQEICFIPDQDYSRFIEEYQPGVIQPGKIVDHNGNVMAEHNGIINYTIGQRKGLGIAAPTPLYVTEIRPETNEVVVGDAAAVYSDKLYAANLNWIAISELNQEIEVEAKIRYAASPARAAIRPYANNQVEVIFDQPQRAITPGQAVVFYRGDLVIGGGTIEK